MAVVHWGNQCTLQAIRAMSDDQASLISDEAGQAQEEALHEGQWYIIDPTGIRLFWIIVTARRVLFYSLDNIGGAPIFFIDIATITALVPKDNTLISIESLGRKYWIQRYGVKRTFQPPFGATHRDSQCSRGARRIYPAYQKRSTEPPSAP